PHQLPTSHAKDASRAVGRPHSDRPGIGGRVPRRSACILRAWQIQASADTPPLEGPCDGGVQRPSTSEAFRGQSSFTSLMPELVIIPTGQHFISGAGTLFPAPAHYFPRQHFISGARTLLGS